MPRVPERRGSRRGFQLLTASLVEVTYLMGANTYRHMSSFAIRDSPAETDGFTADENAVDGLTRGPRLVFSASLEEPLTWANSTLVCDDSVGRATWTQRRQRLDGSMSRASWVANRALWYRLASRAVYTR